MQRKEDLETPEEVSWNAIDEQNAWSLSSPLSSHLSSPLSSPLLRKKI